MWVLIIVMCIVVLFLINVLLRQMIKYEKLKEKNSYTNYEIQNIVQEIDRKLKETKTLQESNFIRILEKNTELQNFKSEVEYYINNKSIVEANDKIKDLLSQQR